MPGAVRPFFFSFMCVIQVCVKKIDIRSIKDLDIFKKLKRGKGWAGSARGKETTQNINIYSRYRKILRKPRPFH